MHAPRRTLAQECLRATIHGRAEHGTSAQHHGLYPSLLLTASQLDGVKHQWLFHRVAVSSTE
eukprot:7366979-Alexandrium_andersonii.AAC.1